MIEIIILAIISFFLFKKLKSMLGDEYDDEMFGYNNSARKEKKRKIKDAEQVHEEEREKSELESGDYNYLSTEALKHANTLRDEIGGFTLNRFKRIATKVLETVIKANEEQKKDEIKQFMTSELAEAVLASFAGENRNQKHSFHRLRRISGVLPRTVLFRHTRGGESRRFLLQRA